MDRPAIQQWEKLILKLGKGCNQLFFYENTEVINIMLGTMHNGKVNFNHSKVAPYTVKVAGEEMQTARHCAIISALQWKAGLSPGRPRLLSETLSQGEQQVLRNYGYTGALTYSCWKHD